MNEIQPPSSLTSTTNAEVDIWSVEYLQRWLRVGLVGYTLEGKGPVAFPDIAHLIMNTGSLPDTFRVLADRLSEESHLMNLKQAVASVLSTLDARERYVPVIEQLLAIAVAIKATPVLKVLGGKIGNGFFGETTGKNDNSLFTMALYTVARLADPDQQDAKRCLYHLIGSANFKPAHAATALIALCQIDPESLPEHLSRRGLRERLAQQFERYDSDSQLRSHVAHQIFLIIGLDNLVNALPKLKIFNSNLMDDADDWLIKALTKPDDSILKIGLTDSEQIYQLPDLIISHRDPTKGEIRIEPGTVSRLPPPPPTWSELAVRLADTSSHNREEENTKQQNQGDLIAWLSEVGNARMRQLFPEPHLRETA